MCSLLEKWLCSFDLKWPLLFTWGNYSSQKTFFPYNRFGLVFLTPNFNKKRKHIIKLEKLQDS
jgi:hypothetical protein